MGAIDGYLESRRIAIYDSFASILENTNCVLGAYYFNKAGTVKIPLDAGVHPIAGLPAEDKANLYQAVLLWRAGATLCTHSMEIYRPPGMYAKIHWDRIIGQDRMKRIEEGFRNACLTQPQDTLEIFGVMIPSYKDIDFVGSTTNPCIWVSEFVARQVADLFRKGHPSCAHHRLATKFTKMPSVHGKETCYCVACDWESGKSYIYDISRNEIRNEIKWEFDLEKLDHIQH